MTIHAPRRSDDEIAATCRRHLEAAVRIDSQSDESSPGIPSSPGQARLGDACAAELERHGADVERDAHGNLIASLPARHVTGGTPPLALLVHLDTARGTRPLDALLLDERWDGSPIPYPARPGLVVDAASYPETAPFVGHDLLHGRGDAPFGLDDKLGLAQMVTLAELLAGDDRVARPPLLLVARPDEEIGRMEAVKGLAGVLAARGVRAGFTLDGILPHEINLENFNAAVASIEFADAALRFAPDRPHRMTARLELGGVNTHGATARAEGHRAATRLAAEIVARLEQAGMLPDAVIPIAFESDAARDCDAVVRFAVGGRTAGDAERAVDALAAAAADVAGPHVPRGATHRLADPRPARDSEGPHSAATLTMLRFVRTLLGDTPGFPIAAEESSGREGYTAPYRALPIEGGVRLDVRLRDFDQEGLESRKFHLRRLAGAAPGASIGVRDQYVNMGPRLAARPELADWPREAARLAGVQATIAPIRGGTGVDPFLDRGIAIANLGTGYFAPESEKEFTSLQMMARHVRWLFALVQVVARARGGA